jgi:hypothetical protein
MVAVCASEMSAEFCRITWHNISEGGILKLQFCHLFSLTLEKLGLTRNIYGRDMTNIYENILPRVGVPWLIITGSGLDDWHTFTHFGSTGNTALSLFYTLSVHRWTRTRIVSLHQSYPGNGFITVSLSLQLTHDIFLAQSNFFLAISCSCQFRRLDPTLFRLLFCTPTASELPIPIF